LPDAAFYRGGIESRKIAGAQEPKNGRNASEFEEILGWRRGSESVASSVVSALKMPHFADESKHYTTTT
jgi:hypothetical protein